MDIAKGQQGRRAGVTSDQQGLEPMLESSAPALQTIAASLGNDEILSTLVRMRERASRAAGAR